MSTSLSIIGEVNKIKSDYLNVKGLNVNDNFIIDEEGAVTINNGYISWGSINESRDIDDLIDGAYDAADEAGDIARKIAGGQYSASGKKYPKKTFIEGDAIYSPKIYGNEINIYTDDNNQGDFNYYANMTIMSTKCSV